MSPSLMEQTFHGLHNHGTEGGPVRRYGGEEPGGREGGSASHLRAETSAVGQRPWEGQGCSGTGPQEGSSEVREGPASWGDWTFPRAELGRASGEDEGEGERALRRPHARWTC